MAKINNKKINFKYLPDLISITEASKKASEGQPAFVVGLGSFKMSDVLPLTSIDIHPKIFWQSKGGLLYLGLGSAFRIDANNEEEYWKAPTYCQNFIKENIFVPSYILEYLKFFGAMTFDNKNPQAPRGFSPIATFIMPKWFFVKLPLSKSNLIDVFFILPVHQDSDECSVQKAICESANELISHLNNLNDQPNFIKFKSKCKYVPLPPDKAWLEGVEQSLKTINNQAIKKIVLSRQIKLENKEDFDPWTIIHMIRHSHPQTNLFCFNADSKSAFLGASPETLLHITKDKIQVDALAGTAKRGLNAAEDNKIKDQLLTSRKDLHEHAVVVERIIENLRPMLETINFSSQPAVIQLTNLQHLYTSINGTIAPGFNLTHFLRALHPTPALGGEPKELASKLIREFEPSSRGWYAAPLGHVGMNDSCFAVAIRSIQIDANKLTIYVGAGIVSGSDPVSEWNETELKAKGWLDLLVERELATYG